MEQHYARIYVVCTGIYFKRWGKIFKSYDDIESNLNLQQQQEKKKKNSDWLCMHTAVLCSKFWLDPNCWNVCITNNNLNYYSYYFFLVKNSK